MRAFLILASLSVLVSAEPPTGYSHRSSTSELNFQPVPSVAQIHIPPSASPRSLSVSSPSSSPGGLSASATSTIARYAAPPQSLTAAAITGPSSHHLHHHHQQATAYSSQQAVYAAPTSSQAQPTAYSASTASQQQQQPSYATAYSSPQTAPQLQTFAYPQVHIQTEPQYAAPSQIQSSSQHQQQYSLPPQQVQVNYGAAPPLPPGASYGPPPVVTGAGPDHNIEYRVVYVKGPKGPSPDVVLPPPPPKQKTIVYILIPRIEKPDPILIQPPPSTPPSKPEVYFIRYKASKKSKPSSEYGAPFGSASAPKPVVVDSPSNRKRSTDAVGSTTSRAPARPTATTTATTTDSATVPTVAYGERVRKQ